MYAALDILDLDAGMSIRLLHTDGTFFVGLFGSISSGERLSMAIQEPYVAVVAEFRGTCVRSVPCGFHFKSESAVGLDASFACAATSIEAGAVYGSIVEAGCTEWVAARPEGG
jgi:hypothetical protein